MNKIENFRRKKGEGWELYIRNPKSKIGENKYTFSQLVGDVENQFSNNYPSYEQLAKDGWLLEIDPVGFDDSIHKLIPDSFSDNGVNVWQDYEGKTSSDFDTMADSRLVGLGIEVTNFVNEKIGGHIDADEVSHWLGVSAAYDRQHSLWLEEFTLADIEQRMPDEVTYPPLTFEDHQVWFSLSLIQSSTSSVRGAARAIIAILHQMTSDEVNALPVDWVANNLLWP